MYGIRNTSPATMIWSKRNLIPFQKRVSSFPSSIKGPVHRRLRNICVNGKCSLWWMWDVRKPWSLWKGFYNQIMYSVSPSSRKMYWLPCCVNCNIRAGRRRWTRIVGVVHDPVFIKGNFQAIWCLTSRENERNREKWREKPLSHHGNHIYIYWRLSFKTCNNDRRDDSISSRFLLFPAW